MSDRFKEAHTTLFTYALDLDVEVVNLRAVVEEKVKEVVTPPLEIGEAIPSERSIRSRTTLVRIRLSPRFF
jgi:5-oxoprolinase (ATP-hydrolysing)